jgi:hypothetical protein
MREYGKKLNGGRFRKENIRNKCITFIKYNLLFLLYKEVKDGLA